MTHLMRVPDFDAVRDKRMSELTPAQQEDARELWVKEQIGWFPEFTRGHVAFLLERLDAARGVGINGLTEAETNATASVFGLAGDGSELPAAVQPPEFQEATWGVDSVMRPCKSMAVSEYEFRRWAEANGIVLAAGAALGEGEQR